MMIGPLCECTLMESFNVDFTIAGASQVALVVKNLPDNEGDIRDMGLILDFGRYPGGGHGNPLQYSCLENPMDRRAWRVTIHRVSQSQTRLKQLRMHEIK